MSAATALASLSQLAATSPGTQIVYVTRASGRPFAAVEGDVLPQRSALCALGNSAASGGIACNSCAHAFARAQTQTHSRTGITHIGGSSIMSLLQLPGGLIRVELTVSDEKGSSAVRVEDVHEVITCTGFRPDMSILEELQARDCLPISLICTLCAAIPVASLVRYGPKTSGSFYPTISHVAHQVHLCYASGGPMALAATLIGSSGDCMLQQVRFGLSLPPPFFILCS